MNERFQKIKNHVIRHKTVYISTTIGVATACFTYLVMRDKSEQDIQDGFTVLAKGGTTVLGKSLVLNQVSYFDSERKGPPSWVVRCIETGAVFTSQAKAAAELELDASNLSKHLNGVMDNVNGLHFERICMAA